MQWPLGHWPVGEPHTDSRFSWSRYLQSASFGGTGVSASVKAAGDIAG